MAEYTRHWKRIYAACFAGGITDFYNLYIWPMVMAFLIDETTFLGSGETAEIIGGLMITLFTIGNTLGAFIMAYPADRWGRKKTLQLTIGWYALGTFLTGFAPNWTAMTGFRIFQGIGNGGEDTARVPYVTETVPAKHRALAVGGMQTSQVIGAILAVMTVPAIIATWGWRACWFVGIIPAVLILAVRFMIPESKRWIEEAKAIKEKKGVRAKVQYSELFKGGYLKTTVLAMILFIIVLSASWGVSFWLPTFLEDERHFSLERAGMISAASMIAMLVGSIAWGKIADVIGRKKSLYISAPLAAILLVLFTMMTDLPMILVTAFGFGFFSGGCSSLVYTLASEWYPTKIRATGFGFTMFVGRAVAAVCAGILPGFAAGLASLAWVIAAFGISLVILAPVVHFGIESAKKELEEIKPTGTL